MSDNLKCLKCGHEYTNTPDPKKPIEERICPRCKSNSVRRLPKKD
jgi:predicted Zn-ribbon and HTH transcriptional regulator